MHLAACQRCARPRQNTNCTSSPSPCSRLHGPETSGTHRRKEGAGACSECSKSSTTEQLLRHLATRPCQHTALHSAELHCRPPSSAHEKRQQEQQAHITLRRPHSACDAKTHRRMRDRCSESWSPLSVTPAAPSKCKRSADRTSPAEICSAPVPEKASKCSSCCLQQAKSAGARVTSPWPTMWLARSESANPAGFDYYAVVAGPSPQAADGLVASSRLIATSAAASNCRLGTNWRLQTPPANKKSL